MYKIYNFSKTIKNLSFKKNKKILKKVLTNLNV